MALPHFLLAEQYFNKTDSKTINSTHKEQMLIIKNPTK